MTAAANRENPDNGPTPAAESRRRGRPAEGVEQVDRLHGSEEAKHRLKVILETLTGDRTPESAWTELGIGKTRFYELRQRVLENALSGLEPRPPGRPAKEETPEEAQARLEALQRHYDAVFDEIQLANVREELRMVFPDLVESAPEEREKKARAERNRRKRQRRKRK